MFIIVEVLFFLRFNSIYKYLLSNYNKAIKMKKELSQFAIGLAIFGIAAAFLSIQFGVLDLWATSTNPANVVANVVVGNVIYISISPNTLNFGNLNPNSINYFPNNNIISTNIIDADNGGNLAANILISGGNWNYGAYSFGVSNTFWSATSPGTVNTALTNTLADTNILIPQPNIIYPNKQNTVYFVEVNIPAGTPPGNYLQYVTFENKNQGASAYSVPINAIFSANVQGVCYISLNTLTINFGTVVASANVPTQFGVTDSDNGGNVAANMLVYGSDWVGPTTTFGGSNTLWNPTPLAIYGGNALTTNSLSPQNTGIVIPAPTQSTQLTSNYIYFGLGVPGGAPSGTYTQNIIIENSC